MISSSKRFGIVLAAAVILSWAVFPECLQAQSSIYKLPDATVRMANAEATQPAHGGAAAAQAASVLCGKAHKVTPCVDQPKENDPKITGYAKLGNDGKPASTPGDLVVCRDGHSKVDATHTAKQKKDGTFSFNLDRPLNPDEYVGVTLKGGADCAKASDIQVVAAASTAGDKSGLYTLGLVGVNLTGSTAAQPSQQYFASFNLMAPLAFFGHKCGADRPFEDKCWVWFNPRISSAPEPTSTAVNQLSSTSSLVTGLGTQTIGQAVQTFGIQGGFEWRFMGLHRGDIFGGEKARAATALSLIAGGGVESLNNGAANAPQFQLTCNLYDQIDASTALQKQYSQLWGGLEKYNASASCPTAPTSPTKAQFAFVLPTRSRFYRDYYVGLRLRTFFMQGTCKSTSLVGCHPADTFPGTLDLRLGQDETVSRGMLRGLVATITGSYPLPGSDGALRVFGSFHLRLAANKNTTPLLLVPASTRLNLDDTKLVVQQISPIDQDYFRLGIGVDFVALIHKWVSSPPKQSGTTGTSTTGGGKK